MFLQIVIGTILMIVTTFVHAACTIAALSVLRRTSSIGPRAEWHWSRTGLVAALVVMMFLAALAEIYIWAGVYLALGAITVLEPAVYFSMVTFTTLGYGDVTLNESWRLLGSFQAANGIILFGWSTALIFAFIHRLATDGKPPAAARGS